MLDFKHIKVISIDIHRLDFVAYKRRPHLCRHLPEILVVQPGVLQSAEGCRITRLPTKQHDCWDLERPKRSFVILQ